MHLIAEYLPIFWDNLVKMYSNLASKCVLIWLHYRPFFETEILWIATYLLINQHIY